MKVKMARRFVKRNKWRAIKGEGSPSFWRRFNKCLRICEVGEDVLKRRFSWR